MQGSIINDVTERKRKTKNSEKEVVGGIDWFLKTRKEINISMGYGSVCVWVGGELEEQGVRDNE